MNNIYFWSMLLCLIKEIWCKDHAFNGQMRWAEHCVSEIGDPVMISQSRKEPILKCLLIGNAVLYNEERLALELLGDVKQI